MVEYIKNISNKENATDVKYSDIFLFAQKRKSGRSFTLSFIQKKTFQEDTLNKRKYTPAERFNEPSKHLKPASNKKRALPSKNIFSYKKATHRKTT